VSLDRSRSVTLLAGVALLLGSALSCASSKRAPDPAAALRSGIGEVVSDSARAAKMLATVDEIAAAVGDLQALVVRERAALLTLLSDYGSSRAAVEASLAEYNTARESLARRVLTAHAAFKAEATAPEWEKLRKLEQELIMFAATNALDQGPATEKEG
jgi:hypothetical protein